MSGSTTNLDLINTSQASKEVTANALFDAGSVSMFLGRRALTSVALTWGYYGGACVVAGIPTAKTNGTLTLTASATNYIEYDNTTGAIAKNVTVYASDALWLAALAAANKSPLYKIVAGAATVTSYVDWRYSSIGGCIPLLSNTPYQGIGYAAGSGGAVTQLTSRTTGVTLNKPSGAITLVSAAGTPSWQSLTVTNTLVAATDTIVVNQKSGADLNQIFVTAVAAGSFVVSFATTGGVTVEQPVFNFSIIKGVIA
jgi:hypothetical protein